MEKYFTVFFNRTQEHLSGYFIDGVYTRATTVFTSGEGFGELFILLFPFSLYKFFVSKNKLYLFVIASLFLGTMLSGTRSAFLLIVFQFLVFVYILVARKYNTKRFIITVGSIFICVPVLSSVLNYSSVLMDRVQVTLDQVKSKVSDQVGSKVPDQVGSKVPGQVKSKVQDRVRSKVDIVTIVNRQGVWPMAYDLTKNTISLFGHGPIQAHRLGFPVKNFHCLYLSMLFQFGIMGTAVFLLFFYTMAKRLLKPVKKIKYKSTDYLLAVTCLLSLLCFLINEIKFEFNRSDSYQQFVWIIFAVFYLTGQLWRNSTHEKTHYHQPVPIRASN
jgi:O-antigen ligase